MEPEEMSTRILIKLKKTGEVFEAISYGFGAYNVKGEMFSKKSYTVIQVIK
jgi:hypothetical protein